MIHLNFILKSEVLLHFVLLSFDEKLLKFIKLDRMTTTYPMTYTILKTKKLPLSF